MVRQADLKVSLIARTELTEAHDDALIELGGAASYDAHYCDRLPETAGRLCYMSFKTPRPGGNAAYLENIRRQGHGSVLEHASATFLIEGVSRSLTHELVRHRAGFAFSQVSQRYVDESDVAFVVPPDLRGTQLEELALSQCETCLETYKLLVSSLERRLADGGLTGTELRKAARSAARCVLPNMTETKIVVTANLRAWRHFVEMRGSKHADREIRELAAEILIQLKEIAPNVFADYAVKDGEIATETRKV